MRRSDREIFEKNSLLKILEEADVCRIALHSGKAPYIVPLNFGFAWENSLEIYFHCAHEGRKLELLKQNNCVGFEIDTGHSLITAETACNWGMKYRSIIGIGRIFQISDEKEKETALDRIMVHYNFKNKPMYDKEILKNTVVLKMTIEEMTGKEKA
jgi:nitroimidazol reductase NimA-like FMN-containing flavoprotein (pyridoxamine 5'-phosphate oxidase superfamily)